MSRILINTDLQQLGKRAVHSTIPTIFIAIEASTEGDRMVLSYFVAFLLECDCTPHSVTSYTTHKRARNNSLHRKFCFVFRKGDPLLFFLLFCHLLPFNLYARKYADAGSSCTHTLMICKRSLIGGPAQCFLSS